MDRDPAVATFANHRGVVPMLWVFAGLALIELLAVHLVVSLRWPVAAWPLSAVTALSVVWLVRWIVSWRRLPHALHADRLLLNKGSLRRVELPLAEIAAVHADLTGDLLKRRDSLNLVPIAYPNRIVELREPLSGRRRARRVAIRVDDPQSFDEAMRNAGIAVG